MTDETIFYRRNLPHIQPRPGIFFITFRLAGSLPNHVIEQLKKDRQKQLKALAEKGVRPSEFKDEKYKVEKRNFAKFDEWLDKCTEGPVWLKDARVAQIVADKIHELDKKRYHLICYCIMSNHVHLLIGQTESHRLAASNRPDQTKNYLLTDTLRLLKGSTARLCNLHLGRSGKFWHNESYDHYVRDEEEFARSIEYILYNPVKAGLVENWQDWKFTYLDQGMETA